MSKHWTLKEHEALSENLVDGIALSTLQSLIPTRTTGGIKVQASKMGFRSTTVNGDTFLFNGIKRRQMKEKELSIEHKQIHVPNEDTHLYCNEIIPLTEPDAFNVNQMAVQFLTNFCLPYEPKIIYELSEYLIRYEIKELPCQKQLTLKY